ncbi:MAG TPA: DUF6036 family nucleotidyltransferase [Solirubrobacteraceae bacterium]|nr:DUF6036 family nucleotidyltransferase [Solirubrobacteraceae bacterium]
MPERPARSFTRAEILKALQALGDELSGQGVRGQIFVVGGAAMALAYSTRRVTKDIDAVFEPKGSIYEAAAKVAENLGLPEDWLNDAAKGFMPGEDEDPRPVPDIQGIEITTASPQYLLAMKLMAMRFGEDDEDIELLIRECHLHSEQETMELLERLYPTREPLPKTRFFLEEFFERRIESPDPSEHQSLS